MNEKDFRWTILYKTGILNKYLVEVQYGIFEISNVDRP